MADFVRRSELWTYDVFPKVIKAGKESTVHIRPFGGRNFFSAGSVREAVVTWLNGGDIEDAPASAFRKEIDVTANSENGLDIKMLFPYEGEYRIRVEGETPDGDKKRFTFCVYAVSDDLVGVYPFMGDLHMHTNFSDGAHDPENVAATYRSRGYDFLAITDHHRYYPSLRAIEAFKNIPTEFNLVPGEEVHLPSING